LGGNTQGQLRWHVAPARLEDYRKREREQDQQQHERNGHAESLTLSVVDDLESRGDRQRRHVHSAPTRRISRQDIGGVQPDGLGVRLEEPADEDLARQLVESVMLDCIQRNYWDASDSRHLRKTDAASLPVLAQGGP
jgi:hypothetical protein